MRINYCFLLRHVYYQFSDAMAFGNVCPWLNGPSVLLHRNTAVNQLNFKINNSRRIANITLSTCPFDNHVGYGIDNVIIIRKHKCNGTKCRQIFNAI